MVPPDHDHLVAEFLGRTFKDEWDKRFDDDFDRKLPIAATLHQFNLRMFEFERIKGNYSATMQNIASLDAVIYIPYDKETMVLCHESRTCRSQTSRFIITPGLYTT